MAVPEFFKKLNIYCGIFLLSILVLKPLATVAAPLEIDNMRNIVVSCASDLEDSLTTCSFNLPTEITSIPSDLHLAIGTDVDPEGICTQSGSTVDCDGIPVGRLNNSQIYAAMGSGQAVQTSGSNQVLRTFAIPEDDLGDDSNIENLIANFGELDDDVYSTQDNDDLEEDEPTQDTENTPNETTTTENLTNFVLIRSGGARIGAMALAIVCLLFIAMSFRTKKGVKKNRIKLR
ncbi:MAG: hypothetical protein AAGF07_02125 [Patescibacteria group bacterium]